MVMVVKYSGPFLLLIYAITEICAQYDDHYPEGYNNNYNVDYDDDDQDTHLWTFLGKNVVFWVLYGIFVLLAGVVPLAFFLLLLAARIINCTTEQAKIVYPPKESAFQCMFCMKIFEAFEWDEHRVSCFRVNKQVFDGMPAPYNFHCPTCETQPLHLISTTSTNFTHSRNSATIQRFLCQSALPSCPAMGYLRNDGTNRLGCYRCGYDLCRTCLRKKIDLYVHPIDVCNEMGGGGGGVIGARA